ncbi:MAG: condensation domain-containing protein, partial [Bacilli bacterium]
IGEDLLVGHLVNLLPLRITINENYNFKNFLKLVRSEMFDAFDHQSYSYGNLIKDLHNIPRDSSKMPLMNVVFNIDQQAPNQGLFLNEIKTELATIPRDYENFELFINASSCGDNLILECQYNTNLFSQSLIENWLSNYLELLNHIVKNPDANILDYSLSFLKVPKVIASEFKTEKDLRHVKRDLVLEAKITQIWENELGLDDINPDDNFFFLGGHSILAIEIASRMENSFKKKITIKDIFENPSVMELGIYLSANDEAVKDLLPKVTKTGFEQYDVSFGQMQTWYLEELNPGTLMHNLPAAIRIKKNLDFEALNEAFHLIIEKQEALRTVIVVEAGVPVQKIKNISSDYLKVEVENITEDEIDEKLKKESQFHFDLKKNPLMKVKLFKLSNQDYILFFMVHHSIWDGWSFDIFFKDLDRVYSSLVQRTPLEYKEPDVSYIDYTHWLNKLIKEDKLKNEESYWLKKLGGALPVLEMPSDFKRPLVMNNESSSFHFNFKHELISKLRYYAKVNNSSVFNVILTAYKVVLARYTNLDDIIVGMPVRGRTKSELTNTIGYFVNTVALRSSIYLNQSFEKNLEFVSKNCAEAFDNQLYPFQLILNSLNIVKDSGRTPVFQTFLTYQDVSNRDAVLDGHKYEQVNIESHSTHTDLDIWFKSSNNKIEGAINYRKDLFKDESIAR